MNNHSKFWPWKVSLFLLFATMISYLDRQAFSFAGPVIQKELGLDNGQLGTLLSSFFLAYGIMHFFIGWFLDKFNIKKVYAIFVGLWSLAQMLTAFPKSFAGLYSFRFSLGIFEAAAQPGAARILSRLFEKKDRTLANGIMMSGGSLGAIIAPIVMVFFINHTGWRTGFIILGGVGILWSLLWLLWFKAPESVLKGTQGGTKILTAEDSWKVIFRNPKFWACTLGALFTIPIIHITGAWLPTYFVQTWNMKLNVDLAIYLTLIYIGFDLSMIFTGFIIRRLCDKGMAPGKARKYVLVVAGLSMALIGFIWKSPTPLMAVGFAFLLNIGRAAFGSIFLSFNQEIAPARVGTIAGIMGGIGALSGTGFVYLIGQISKTGGFTVPFMIIAALAIAGTIPLLLVNWDKSEKLCAQE
jgi:sugar phosphate permease